MRSELDCSKIKEVFEINPSDYKKGIFLALEAYKKQA